MACLRLAVLVGLAGCGRISFDPTDPQQTWRLEQSYFELDGLRTPAGIYDSLRGEPCSLIEWQDGRVRCTPSGPHASYSDPSCELPVGTGAETAYYIEYGTVAEPGLRHVWTRGAVRPLTEYYSRGPNAICQGPTPNMAPAFELVEVLPEELAELEIVTPATGDRLVQQLAQEGAGAPRFAWQTLDTVLDELCVVTTRILDMPTLRCMPLGAYFEQLLFFSDASCTELASNFFQTVVPDYFVVDTDQCATTPETVHATTDVVPGASLYRLQPGCTFTGGTTGSVIHLSPAIETPLLVRNTVPGLSRLSAVTYVGAGIETRVLAFYDESLSVPCNASINTAEATVRCLPNGDLAQTKFSDAACTVPIDLVRYTPCGATHRPLFVSVIGSSELRDIGALYVAPVYAFNGATCDLDTSGAEYYEVGPTTAYTPVTGPYVVDP